MHRWIRNHGVVHGGRRFSIALGKAIALGISIRSGTAIGISITGTTTLYACSNCTGTTGYSTGTTSCCSGTTRYYYCSDCTGTGTTTAITPAPQHIIAVDTTPPPQPVIPSDIAPTPPVVARAPAAITPIPLVFTPAPPVVTPAPPLVTPALPVFTPTPPISTPTPPVYTPAPLASNYCTGSTSNHWSGCCTRTTHPMQAIQQTVPAHNHTQEYPPVAQPARAIGSGGVNALDGPWARL
ncbi:hypothetical protein M427DRAFT_54392 [Gonapodya prolifera JEL478]|uniref:Uncharacterized protein n=1 Tax=Gonapodya prolifera (strain JEL478) TaxID=1344416 RepID=A0A139AM22_GONPJ|nr:hypothetical protein M427DRAFT_54392 [Gonapodya prolifera JEL478]|eukprot:KXS17811.1 hypothetical protein M427DRAFT_54392 [Gonapodya prolifera JEL478]